MLGWESNKIHYNWFATVIMHLIENHILTD